MAAAKAPIFVGISFAFHIRLMSALGLKGLIISHNEAKPSMWVRIKALWISLDICLLHSGDCLHQTPSTSSSAGGERNLVSMSTEPSRHWPSLVVTQIALEREREREREGFIWQYSSVILRSQKCAAWAVHTLTTQCQHPFQTYELLRRPAFHIVFVTRSSNGHFKKC